MSQPSAAASDDASTGTSARAAARPVIELKGLSHPALRLVIHEPADAAIAAAFEAMVAEDPGFEWQPVVIDASRIAEQPAPDWTALVARLRAARLHPVAIAGAPEAAREQAEALQLGWLAALPERRRTSAAAEPAVASRSSDQGAPAAGEMPSAVHARSGEVDASTEESPSADASADASPSGTGVATADAMVVSRPVRSGQQLYSRGRDLVVVGDVSPGAEVIADGNVHVYGTLAGRAIAGARGLREASIFALDLRAELVAVCGIYRTFEDGVPEAHAGRPVRVTLQSNADTLTMTSL
jgi:septum site-determining protein MinC